MLPAELVIIILHVASFYPYVRPKNKNTLHRQNQITLQHYMGAEWVTKIRKNCNSWIISQKSYLIFPCRCLLATLVGTFFLLTLTNRSWLHAWTFLRPGSARANYAYERCLRSRSKSGGKREIRFSSAHDVIRRETNSARSFSESTRGRTGGGDP